MTPKTVGAALVEVFAMILPVEATTRLVDAPFDIGSEPDVCNAWRDGHHYDHSSILWASCCRRLWY